MKYNALGISVEAKWPYALALIALLLTGEAFVVCWAWNTLAVVAFGAKEWTVWQAFAAMIFVGFARHIVRESKS